jgi:hypothetical protein
MSTSYGKVDIHAGNIRDKYLCVLCRIFLFIFILCSSKKTDTYILVAGGGAVGLLAI